jgi:hypothetical protein
MYALRGQGSPPPELETATNGQALANPFPTEDQTIFVGDNYPED